MKISKTEFEDVAKQVCDEVDGVSYYGEYGGRFYFKGLAISAEDAAAAADAYARLKEEFPDLPRWNHQDSLGLGIIVAWGDRIFTD